MRASQRRSRRDTEGLTNLHGPLVNFDTVELLSSGGRVLGLGELDSSDATRATIGAIGENGAADRSNHVVEVLL